MDIYVYECTQSNILYLRVIIRLELDPALFLRIIDEMIICPGAEVGRLILNVILLLTTMSVEILYMFDPKKPTSELISIDREVDRRPKH